ncbi:MAG: FAD-dependent monooxygenase [Alphaproteobacteria bacterium]|nr:FAD-dependent monooxygenase [Alphaproteobacteria bacterium]
MSQTAIRPLKVLIIGAGTGGLCLAHGLRSVGVAVRVFERDHTPTDRIQGYRLNISATGNRALKACLPGANYQRFVEASATSSSSVTFLDQHLKRLLRINIPPVDRASIESERPVSRIALRRVLLDGVEDLITFGRTFERYEDGPDGHVTAHFQNGLSESADLMVGADGASSRVARQLLPSAHRIDTGIVAISGRFPIDDLSKRNTPTPVFQGPTLIVGPPGVFMFASAVEYPPEADPIYDRDQYVMWGISARREDFALPSAPEHLSPEEARSVALAKMTGWAPALREMVARADPTYITAFSVKTASEVGPWRTRNVTLLGDALHNMTPFRGMGANAALYDAELLRGAIIEVANDRTALEPALATYERAMIEHGFRAVRSSLADMKLLHAEALIQRALMKAMFRLLDAAPPLQRAFRGQR